MNLRLGSPSRRQRCGAAAAPRRVAGAALVLGVALGLPGAPVQAAPQTLSCPLRILTEAVLVADTERLGAFKPVFHDQSLAYLTGLAVFEGPPASAAEMPARPAGTHLQQWVFGEAMRPVMVCRYEGGVQLTRALPAGVKACVGSLQVSPPRDASGHGLEFAVLACQ